MWKFIVQMATQLSWLFSYLLYRSFATPSYDFELAAEATESLVSKVHYENRDDIDDESSEIECAVCLGGIKEGEEVRELKCAHLFHKACLDRWTSLKHVTCPLCRNFLAPPAREKLVEVIRFKFWDFPTSEDDRDDTWWFR